MAAPELDRQPFNLVPRQLIDLVVELGGELDLKANERRAAHRDLQRIDMRMLSGEQIHVKFIRVRIDFDKNVLQR